MNIETQLRQLPLHSMGRSWTALMETRKHHELSFAEGMEVLLQADEEMTGVENALNASRRTHTFVTRLRYRKFIWMLLGDWTNLGYPTLLPVNTLPKEKPY